MKTKIKIDRAQILALNPCDRAITQYDAQITRGYDSWREVLKDESIELVDRIWVGIRALPDDKTKRLFACWCAEQALNQIHPSKWDESSLNAIKVARRFALGKADSLELQQARRAAYAAAAAADAYADAAADAYAADAAAYAAAAAAYAADAAAAYAAAYAAAAAADAADAYAAASAAAYARERMRRHELKRLIRLYSEVKQ